MRTPLGSRLRCAAWRRRRRRRRQRDVAARLAVRPGVAAGRSRPASSSRPVSARSWPVSLPWNCWVRSQLSCSLPRRRHRRAGPALPDRVLAVGAQRPGDDLQAAFGAADEAHALAVAGERRHARWSPGSTPGPAPTARSRSRGAAICSSRTWFDSRVRDDAVDALPGHQRHDRHDDHGDQHLDQGEAVPLARRAVIDESAQDGRQQQRSGGRRRRASARRRGGSSGSASAARPACRRRCGRAARS